MKLLDDETLDEEIINGLIKTLKIPLPHLQNPPSHRQILFPARFISLLAKQMWKFGCIKESERLFVNIMKTIQEHVMVSRCKSILEDVYFVIFSFKGFF
jgi:myosin-5